MSSRLESESATVERIRACLIHRTQQSELRLAAAFDHLVAADVGCSHRAGNQRRTGPTHRPRRTRSRSAADADQVRRLRVVGRPLGVERLQDRGRRRPRPPPWTPAGTGWWPAQRGLSRRVLVTRRRRGGRRSGRAAGRSVRAVPPAAGQRARRGAGHPGQRPDRHRVRGARVLGDRDVRASGADGDCAGGGGRRAAVASARPCPWLGTGRAPFGLRGAAFAWRTIRGEECGRYWPAGTAAFHVNADIAVAAARQVCWTDDADFDRECALPILVETARLWHRLGYLGADGRFHLDGVTGPDEYSALADDNTYTNLWPRRTSRRRPRRPALAGRGGRRSESTTTRSPAGDDAAEAMAVPYDDDRAMPEQDRGSTRRERWDFAASDRAGRYPLHETRAVLRPLPQAGGQAGRSGAGPALVRRPVLARRRRRPRSRTTRGSPSATPPCRRAPRP